jgi:23S rRNA pseudouridine955/2504/2580 synthase
VHLTHLGHVLAGDDKYGDFSWNRKLASEGLKRMFLHARMLTFTHPASGKSLQIESPLPGDLAKFLGTLTGNE